MITPNAKIHAGFAFMLWLLFTQTVILNPIAMIVGSLIPDCDHRKAIAGMIIPLWLVGVKHRGWTHTLPCMFVASLLLYTVFDWKVVVSFAIGYLSHLMLDACTPMGIRWLKGH